MEEIQDYYELLGVSCNATLDEIKKACNRKRREYQNDKTKSIQLNQAREVLYDSDRRKQYDLKLQYGKQLVKINKKVRESKTLEERNKHLDDAKRIYLNILMTDNENIDALSNLADIEEILGNSKQAIQYLEQLVKYITDSEKIKAYHRMGEIYSKQRRIDEAIRFFGFIYQKDISYTEDVKLLVRLHAENKNNIKVAIQILEDCINRSTESKLKIIYICEMIRVIRKSKNLSYKDVEESMFKNLELFKSNNDEKNLFIVTTIFSCASELVDEKDFECWGKFEKVIKEYNVKNTEFIRRLELMRRAINFTKQGKFHNAIELYTDEKWTKVEQEKLSRLIIKEAEQIKKSLENIKKEIPEYWNDNKEILELEKLINEKLEVSKEYNSLSVDMNISYYMKKMIGYILLVELFVDFKDIKDDFDEARDILLDKEYKQILQRTLKAMKEEYPICYKKFADLFYDEITPAKDLNHVEQISPPKKSEGMSDASKVIMTIICVIIGIAFISTGILAPAAYGMGAIVKQIWKEE